MKPAAKRPVLDRPVLRARRRRVPGAPGGGLRCAISALACASGLAFAAPASAQGDSPPDATGSGATGQYDVRTAAGRLGIDALFLEYGQSDTSNADVDRYALEARWRWPRALLELGPARLNGYWAARLGYWDNDSAGRTNSGLADIGFAPVLRLEPREAMIVSPYLDAGVGAHLLTESSVSGQRQFGGAFQFASHVGVGVRFGPQRRFDLGYQFQHFSNAGLAEPNNGINFHQIRLGYWF